MAYNTPLSTSALFFIALLFTALNLQPTPLVVDGQPFQLSSGIRVTGRFCCTFSGNCPLLGSGTPVVGATITLICTSFLGIGSDITAQNTTNANGTFVITATGSQLFPGLYPIICRVRTQFPAPNCTSPTSGSLTSSLRRTGSVTVSPGVSVDNSTINAWIRSSL